MMGRSAEYTCHLNTVPRTMYERTQVKTGSAALTVWAKETAPAPRAMTAPAWPRAWAAPIGTSVFHQPGLSFGALRMPDAHSRRMYGTPTKRETNVIVHGMGKAFWHFLLVMLYMTLRKNQVNMRAPSFAVLTYDIGTASLPAGHSASVHSSTASSSMQVAASSTGAAGETAAWEPTGTGARATNALATVSAARRIE